MKNIFSEYADCIKNGAEHEIAFSRVIPFRKSVTVVIAVMCAILLYAVILGQTNFLGVFVQVTIFSIIAAAFSGRMRNSVLACSIILAFGVLIQLTLGMSAGKLQLDILMALIAAAVAAVIYRTNIIKLNKRSGIVIMSAAILLLTAMALATGGIGGASNWIVIGGVSIQATELTKLIYIICLCTVSEHDEKTKLKSFIAACILTLVMVGIYMIQNEFGTILVIMFVFITVLFISFPYKYALYTVGVVILGAILAAGIAKLVSMSGAESGIFGMISNAYTKLSDRIVYWLDPEQDIYNKGYQYMQRKRIMLTTGLFGTETTTSVGIKESDLVLTAVLERFGVVLGVILVMLYALAFWQQITAAHKVRDAYHKRIITAMSAAIAAQVLIIASYTSGIMPITGLCLPFIGRGGTTMMTVFMMYGIMISASDRNIWKSAGTDVALWKEDKIKGLAVFERIKRRIDTEDDFEDDFINEDDEMIGENGDEGKIEAADSVDSSGTAVHSSIGGAGEKFGSDKLSVGRGDAGGKGEDNPAGEGK